MLHYSMTAKQYLLGDTAGKHSPVEATLCQTQESDNRRGFENLFQHFIKFGVLCLH